MAIIVHRYSKDGAEEATMHARIKVLLQRINNAVDQSKLASSDLAKVEKLLNEALIRL